MLIMVLAVLLILALAFYQSIQGLFSAMILAILALLCALLALNYYEPLAEWLLTKWRSGYVYGISLLGLYVVLLLGLRELFDRLVPGNVVLGLWTGRVGGFLVGLVSGTIMVGMILLVVQLLPLPARFLGYQPYDQQLVDAGAGPAGWAGNFTLSLARGLSGGSLSAIGAREPTLGTVHPDLLRESHALRNRPAGTRMDAQPGNIDVVSAQVVPEPKGKQRDQYTPQEALYARIHELSPQNPLLVSTTTKLLVVRVNVSDAARDDKAGQFVLPATHFRLVARDAEGQTFDAWPIGYLTYSGSWRVNTSADKNAANVADLVVTRPWSEQAGPKTLVVDWLYRLRVKDQPEYVAFRQSARAEVMNVTEGLPSNTDKTVALGVKSVTPTVEFLPVRGAGVVHPASMEIRNRQVPSDLMLRPESPENPGPAFRKLVLADGAIKAVEIAGRREDLQKGTGTARVFSDFSTNGNQVVVKLKLAFDAKLNDSPTAKKLLAQMKPQLKTDAQSPAAWHRGAWLVYTVSGSKFGYMYYDVDRKPGVLEPEFLSLLAANAGSVIEAGLIFTVPTSKDGNIVSLDLGLGPMYEFLPTHPLATQN